MKDHMQKIINVCFAIFITMYIIQNDKLNEQVELLNKEVEAANIGLIKTLYSDYNTAFIKNDFPRIASHFEAPVNFASDGIIAEKEKDVVERYEVMKATIQEGYAYSITGDVAIKRQSENSYLLVLISRGLINKKKFYLKDELNINGSMLQIEDGR